MSVSAQVSHDQSTVTIRVDGMFDLSVQSSFREAYEQCAGATKYIIDLRDIDYMDSAAFGMLLVFRDHVGGDQADIRIVNAGDEIVKSFQMLHFDRMFNLGNL